MESLFSGKLSHLMQYLTNLFEDLKLTFIF